MAEEQKKGWRRLVGIGAIAGAIGLGYGIGTHKDQILNGFEDRTIQVNALNLEKKIEFRNNGSEYKTYSELKPYFLIIKKSFSIENESDVQFVLNAITQILAHLETKKKEYGGPTNPEYNFIIQQYEPNLKAYFKYVVVNLKAKYPNNDQLKNFSIK